MWGGYYQMGAGRRSIFKSIRNEVPSMGCYYGSYGSIATLGASLDEFAGDLKAILDAKLKNL